MVSFAAALLRGVILVFVGALIAGGAVTLAAYPAPSQRPRLVAVSSAPRTLTVPHVTGHVYVFAKGILQDGGFAWRVIGSARGYAGNTVVDQQPSAGVVVLDTGAPTVTLTLARTRSYAERGMPDDTSPYKGTAVRIPAPTPLPRAAHSG